MSNQNEQAQKKLHEQPWDVPELTLETSTDRLNLPFLVCINVLMFIIN
jgi:hypothetical protein